MWDNSYRKRDYKNKSNDSIGFLGSSEILDVYPKAEKYISKTQAQAKGLIAKLNEILISCSGTIGNISLVSKTISHNALSQHMIRAYAIDYYGYIYSFLKKYVDVQNFSCINTNHHVVGTRGWPVGRMAYAEDCKSFYTGSIPVPASKKDCSSVAQW